MFKNNPDFYPTPQDVIRKMCLGIPAYKNIKILEPSAGSGNIVDYLKQCKFVENKNIYCIEQDKRLQEMLIGKKYQVIDNDFLLYEPDMIFDYIIMNPPFSNGEKHFLKAWDIAKNTQIVCLLNAETIKNPYSESRKLILKILEDNNGTYEFLGNCFKESERKTNVEVVMLKVKKEIKNDGFNCDFGGKREIDKDLEFNENQLANPDHIQNLVDRYNALKDLAHKHFSIKAEMNMLTQGLIENTTKINAKDEYNEYLQNLKKAVWDNLLKKTKLSENITATMREKLYTLQEQQGYKAFTVENIEELALFLNANKKNIFNGCVQEAFEWFTAYHEENRIHVEGWKTNKRYIVNDKVILPYAIDSWNVKWADPTLNWKMREKINDVEKACCMLAGKKYDSINPIDSKTCKTFGEWYESEFFMVKLFKKGTMHLKFLDEYIWSQFNIIGSGADANALPAQVLKNRKWRGNI